MRVVSLVPSWTETLLEAGVNVVGRTRFCIHPNNKIANIPAVGGTKGVDWEKIKSLKPDIVIFDKEENTKEMSDACPGPWHATHVRSMMDLPGELSTLAKILGANPLQDLGERWLRVNRKPRLEFDSENPPALVEWHRRRPAGGPVVYVIWRGPWMAAGPETFIGSVFKWFGVTLWGADSKYPEFDPKTFPTNTLFLCSSEPYPFLKKRDVLEELPGSVALVDGERISWFGRRSLLYLESYL